MLACSHLPVAELCQESLFSSQQKSSGKQQGAPLFHTDTRLQERDLLHAGLAPSGRGFLAARLQLDHVEHKRHGLCCVSWIQITCKLFFFCFLNHICMIFFNFLFFFTCSRGWKSLIPTTRFCSRLPLSTRWTLFSYVGPGVWSQGISRQLFFFLFVGSFKEAGERKVDFWLTDAMPRFTWTCLGSGGARKLTESANLCPIITSGLGYYTWSEFKSKCWTHIYEGGRKEHRWVFVPLT